MQTLATPETTFETALGALSTSDWSRVAAPAAEWDAAWERALALDSATCALCRRRVRSCATS